MYRGYSVTLVRNVTDIDDKILSKSAEEGRPWFAHAFKYERAFTQAYAALDVLPPSYEPRATGHITEMIELIDRLIDAGYAYPALDDSGDVYFAATSWADYGELTNQRLEDMEPANDADMRGKKDARDFALWKAHKPGEPGTASWPAPWGRGRPGWHIECSAMSTKYLGENFDIHGGGLDLRFPHHEERVGPVARGWRPVRQHLDAFGPAQRGRGQDVEVARQLGLRLRTLPPLQPAGRALLPHRCQLPVDPRVLTRGHGPADGLARPPGELPPAGSAGTRRRGTRTARCPRLLQRSQRRRTHGVRSGTRRRPRRAPCTVRGLREGHRGCETPRLRSGSEPAHADRRRGGAHARYPGSQSQRRGMGSVRNECDGGNGAGFPRRCARLTEVRGEGGEGLRHRRCDPATIWHPPESSSRTRPTATVTTSRTADPLHSAQKISPGDGLRFATTYDS